MIVWLTMPVEIREGQHVTDKVRLVRRLGGGGMGSVWAAEHTGLGQEVAVKFLDPELAADAALVERFWREAKAASQVKSAHVVHIYDFGVLEGEQPFIVMELLEGQDLADRAAAAGGRLPMHEVVTVVSQLARALARAHDTGIVHRDLKPANVVLCREAGDQMFVKLVDFGIAQFAGPVAHRTRAGIALGSAAYMAPEQAEGKRVDGRADLYAVGVVMHELLTGEVPFLGKTSRETLEIMHSTRAPSAVGDHGAGQVSEQLAKLVQKCMAKRPEDRFETADELRKALLDVASLAPDRSDSTQVMAATRFGARGIANLGRTAKGMSTTAVLGMAFAFAFGILIGILILRWGH